MQVNSIAHASIVAAELTDAVADLFMDRRFRIVINMSVSMTDGESYEFGISWNVVPCTISFLSSADNEMARMANLTDSPNIYVHTLGLASSPPSVPDHTPDHKPDSLYNTLVTLSNAKLESFKPTEADIAIMESLANNLVRAATTGPAAKMRPWPYEGISSIRSQWLLNCLQQAVSAVSHWRILIIDTVDMLMVGITASPHDYHLEFAGLDGNIDESECDRTDEEDEK